MGLLKNIVGIIEAASSWDDVVSAIKRKNTTSQSVDCYDMNEVCMDDIPDSIRNELLTDDEYVILRGHTISDEDDNED